MAAGRKLSVTKTIDTENKHSSPHWNRIFLNLLGLYILYIDFIFALNIIVMAKPESSVAEPHHFGGAGAETRCGYGSKPDV
jgi:hypothetical protein